MYEKYFYLSMDFKQTNQFLQRIRGIQLIWAAEQTQGGAHFHPFCTSLQDHSCTFHRPGFSLYLHIHL